MPSKGKVRRSVAFRHASNNPHMPGASVENFAIDYDNVAKRVEIVATRTRDLLKIRFLLEGFTFNENRNQLWQERNEARVTLFLSSQHIAETIWQEDDHPPIASRLYAPETRLVFERTKSTDAQRLSIAKLFELVQEDAELRVSPRAEAKLANSLEAQLELLNPSAVKPWNDFTTSDLLDSIAALTVPPSEAQTSLELIGKMSLSTTEEASWDFGGDTDVIHDRELRPKVPLHTIRLRDGGASGLRALDTRRFDKPNEPHKGLVGCEDLENASKDTNLEQLMALLPRHHRDLVAMTSVPGLPALMALDTDPEAVDADVKATPVHGHAPTDLPPSRVVLPKHKIGYIKEQEEAHGLDPGSIGIALTQAYERAQVLLTSQGATIDLRYAGEPPLLRLKDPKLYTGFNVEVSDYLTSLGMDWRVETADKGYLFPLGVRCSLVTLVSRRVEDATDPVTGKKKRASRARKITFLKMNGRTKEVKGPYCPFAGRWFPANSVRMHTLLTPRLVKPETNYVNEVPGDYALFWPQVIDPDTGKETDFEFEWDTGDGIAHSKLIFVLNEYVGDEHVMRRLVEQYNMEKPERRMARFPGARLRYAPADTRPTPNGGVDDGRGKTSFDTQYWVMSAMGRVDPFDGDALPTDIAQQHFRMDGRMEGQSQPPFYPRLELARIRVQSADIMLGRMAGGIDVNYYPPYVLNGFGSPLQTLAEDDPEIFLQTIGDDAAAVDAHRNKNRSGGVASFSASIAALSRRVGVIGGQPKKHPLKYAGEARYEFGAAAAGKFDPIQFLTQRKPAAAASGVETGTSSSFSLVLGTLDLNKLKKINITAPSVPELLQKVELGPKVAEALQDAVRLTDEALYTGRNAISHDLAERIDALKPEGLTPEDLFGTYWPTLVRMGFTSKAANPCEFRKVLLLVADTSSDELARSAAAFVRAVDQFGDDTAAFIQNPVPQKIRETFAKVEAVLAATRDKRVWQEVWQSAFARNAHDALDTAFCQALDLNSELALLLFGRQLTCTQLKEDPAGAFHGVEKRLYGGSLSKFSESIRRLFGLIGRLRLPQPALPGQEGVQRAVRDAVFAIVDIVEREAPMKLTGDIRDPAEQNALAVKFREQVTALIGRIMDAGQVQFDDLESFATSLRRRRRRLEADLKRIIDDILAEIDDVILPVRPEHKAQARKRIACELRKRLVAPYVLKPLDEALATVNGELANAKQIHVKLIAAATEGLTELYDLSSMREAIEQAGSMEEDIREAIVGLASTMCAAGQEQLVKLAKVRTTLTTWGGSTPLPWPDKDLRADLIAAIDRIDHQPDPSIPNDQGGLQQQLDTKRADIDLLAEGVIDTPLLKAIGEAVQLRVCIFEEVVAMTRRLATQEAAQAAAAAIPQGLIVDLATLVTLYLPQDGKIAFDDIEATVAKLKAHLAGAGPKADKLTKRVQVELDELKAAAEKLYTDLHEVHSAEALVDLIDEQVPAMLAKIDTRLVGDLAIFYSFPKAAFEKFDQAANEELEKLWRFAEGPMKDLLALFKIIAGDALDAFAVLRSSHYEKYAKYIFGKTADGKDALEEIENAFKAFGTSIGDTLAKFEAIDRDIDYLRSNYKDLANPLAETLEKLIAAIAMLRVNDGKQIVDNVVTTLLADARRMVEEVARELLPTKISTGYTWVSNLEGLLDGLPQVSFSSALKITDKEVIERFGGAAPNDIRMETIARFGMNLLDDKVTSEIRGRIAPIEAIVPTAEFAMATIYLDEITFRSVDGGKPDFSVTIKDVRMGRLLDFLSPLQSALAPGESGLYLVPTLSSVTVGYRYSMGEINLGAVRFLNLAFDISAHMPFTDDKAYFRFQLSTPEWPFLVVSGPYGGGGYLDLSVYPDGELRQMILVAFFGAVSQVRFGPIKASGRIVSGLYVEQSEEAGKDRKSREMRAFFEVSGRASVACFNLSLLFMVYLRQSGKNLVGKATLEISVKRGFLKYTFRADATQRIKGRDDANAVIRVVTANHLTTLPVTTVKLPDKMQHWQKYRELFA